MEKWEYKILVINEPSLKELMKKSKTELDAHNSGFSTEAALNELGQEGWELINFICKLPTPQATGL